MRSRPYAAVLPLCALLTVAACGGDDEPAALPELPSSAPTAPATEPTPTPTPTPSPSPAPLSPFEADPAVQAVRAYEKASVEAINTKNLKLPAFAALATERRQARHPVLYEEDLGSYYPGPAPLTVLGVRVTSPTARSVAACLLDDGFALDEPGGTPTEPRQVVALDYDMVLVQGTWLVDGVFFAEERTCDGVALPGGAA